MDALDLIAKRLAAPKAFCVTTVYDSGKVRTHETETEEQAHNYADIFRHRMNRDLIDRDTGKTIRVTSVTISKIGAA